MSTTTLDVTRSNAVRNPRAHVNNAGFTDATYVAVAPVTLPNPADGCFGVPAGTNRGGTGNGLTIASSWFPLPDGVESGDWLYAQIEVYIDNVVAGDAVFWADLQFRDSSEAAQDWSPWARSLQVSLTDFEHVAGMIEVPGEDATEFRVYLKVDDDRYEGALLADLYFTNVQVEKCYFRNAGIPAYADGDSSGWEWSSTAHNSESHMIASESQSYTDPVPEDVTADVVDNTYTFPPLDDDYVLEVTFGPRICEVMLTSMGGGLTVPSGSTLLENGDPFSATATADAGYGFDHYVIDGVVSGSGSSLSIASVTDHMNIFAFFEMIGFDLAYSANAHGSLTGDTSQHVEPGASGSPVIAVPDTGYRFTSWSDGLTTAGRADTDVEADITVSASFEAVSVTEYDLTYTAGANGSIAGDDDQTVAAGANGTEVVATADTDFRFLEWSDHNKVAARTDRYVSEDITVQATFGAVVTWDLAYSAGTGGTIDGDASQEVEDGANGTMVEAVPSAGYRFEKWSDNRLVAVRRDLNVGADITVTASFIAVGSYTLTYTAGAGGTISGTTPQTVSAGGRGTMVTAVPNVGYHFTSWSDGKTTAARLEVGVNANVTVTANFALNSLTLRYRGIAGGTISGSNPQTVAYGASGTQVTAVPDANYHFANWSDGVLTAARTDTNVLANLRVYARFHLDEHTLTYTAGLHGTLRGDASQSVKYGRHGMPVTAIPDAGYRFVEWSDHVLTARRLDLNVTDAITVSASFEAIP